MWHQKYSLPCTTFLGFVEYIVTSNVLDICAADRSWGDLKTIKSGERSAIRSDVSEKQSIVYISACIESAIMKQNHSVKQVNGNYSSLTSIEEEDASEQQLEEWGVEKLFSSIRTCQNISEILH